MKKRSIIDKLLSVMIVALLVNSKSFCQTDTVFWFAAPEIDSLPYNGFKEDRPIVMNISTYGQAANVIISQPANGGMPLRLKTIPANTSDSIDLTDWINLIECKPGNTVLNTGLKISSSAKISVYYEVNANQTNPDLFALKGKNALGMDFWISSQTLLNNNSGQFSSFNIIATENNTVVNITPSKDIVGHSANIPFSIGLNKGQTYAAIAASGAASQHLDGSYVTSTRPIAISLSDDELLGTVFNGCADLAGDQTVPTNILGNEYIAIRGFLNGADRVFLTAITNGTIIKQDGLVVTTLNAGQTYEALVSNASSYFQGSNSFYAYQMSGIGCEVGTGVLPKLNCTGSSSASFIPTSTENLYVTLLVKNGGQNDFKVNGVTGKIDSSDFTVVPGTSGGWYAAQKPLTYSVGSSIKITNDLAYFHLGVLQGGTLSGTGFGYFSDFAEVEAIAKSNLQTLCSGSSLQLFTDTAKGVVYNWTGPGGFASSHSDTTISNISTTQSGNYILSANLPGCPISYDTLPIVVHPTDTNRLAPVKVCNSQLPYAWFGQSINTSGLYYHTLKGRFGCDSVIVLRLTVITSSRTDTTANVCRNNLPFSWYNQLLTSVGNYYHVTNLGACIDSVVLDFKIENDYPSVAKDTFVCSNHYPFVWNGRTISGSGIYNNNYRTWAGCDSIVFLKIQNYMTDRLEKDTFVCSNQFPFAWRGKTITQAGRDSVTYPNMNGCDSVLVLSVRQSYTASSDVSIEICKQDLPYIWNGSPYSTSGTYTKLFNAANGCDSVATLVLKVSEKPNVGLPPDTSFCRGKSVQITAVITNHVAASYAWSVSSGNTKPALVVNVAGRYFVTVQNTCGADTASSYVREKVCDVTVPNVFSPNSDGVNDVWIISGLENHPRCVVTVFNRYGQVIFEKMGYDNKVEHCWNGTYKRVPVPAYTYYYIIDVEGDGKQLLKGWVAVLR